MDIDDWDAEVTVTATFEITGTPKELGLGNYAELAAPFGAGQLLGAMAASGGTVYRELRKNWGFPSVDELVDVEIHITSKDHGISQASADEEQLRG